jgi:L-ribulokinase
VAVEGPYSVTREAREITEMAREQRPQYLAKCGGTYSSEWFFSKILHCLRTSPKVFAAAHSWMECADWIPAMLTGTEAPGPAADRYVRRGHKAMLPRGVGGISGRGVPRRCSTRGCGALHDCCVIAR